MGRREHQSGFSTTVVLLVVLVVAVLAVTVVVVYQRHKPSSAKNSEATSPSQSATQLKEHSDWSDPADSDPVLNH